MTLPSVMNCGGWFVPTLMLCTVPPRASAALATRAAAPAMSSTVSVAEPVTAMSRAEPNTPALVPSLRTLSAFPPAASDGCCAAPSTAFFEPPLESGTARSKPGELCGETPDVGATSAFPVRPGIAGAMTAAIMVPLSLAIATSTRVSYWLGAGQALRAQRVVYIGFRLAALTGIALAAILFIANQEVASVYSDSPAVTGVASGLLLWVAAYRMRPANPS